MSSLKIVTDQENLATLVLVLRKDSGWSEIADHIEARRSAITLLRETTNLDGALFKVDDDTIALHSRAEELLLQWEGEEIRFSSLFDPSYPKQLLSIRERPLFVTWQGTLSPADEHGIAIVGSRKASDSGLEVARQLANDLARRGVTVVSGLAAGVDSEAHLGALEAGGRTVAIIGTGLHYSYPKDNAALQRRIADTGLVLSQFLPDSPPTRHSFPMRNAVMSGFASATVVVEAGVKSGARMQARLALRHGRPVFFLECLRAQQWALEMSARPGVRFVTSVDEILDSLSRTFSMDDRLVDA